MKNNKAFTLIELLVVVLISGILAAVAVPQYQIAVEKSRATTDLPILRALADARIVYELANGEPNCDLEELDVTFSYKKKSESTNKSYGCDTMQVNYTLENGHRLTIGRTADMLVLTAKGYFFDYYTHGISGGRGYCYSGGKDSALGEKVCKSIGQPVPNTKLYLLP